MQFKAWEGFNLGKWSEEVNVRDFIQTITPPTRVTARFLPTQPRQPKSFGTKFAPFPKKERENGGVLDADTSVVSSLTSHGAGYIHKDLEKIVGLQTDKPFKRSLQPFGGIKMAEQALNMYGYQLDAGIKEVFSKYRKTHNDGVL